MLPLDPDQLRTFIAIAEGGSFTRAAEVVAKTQSAVSMQMRKLEERIGKPLFQRDGRASRLSAEGERLLPYARRLLRLQAETLAAFDTAEQAGTIRLGTPDDYATFLPEILGRFAAHHPLAEMSVVCLPTESLLEAINNDELDIAIITSCHAASRLSPVVARREQLVWVTSERHNVHEEQLLPLALGSTYCDWRRTALRSLEFVGRENRVAFSSSNASAVSAAVLAGLAISVLPLSAVQPGMRVLGVEEGFPGLPRCEIAVLRSAKAESRLAEGLEEHILASLSQVSLPLAA
ncbi:DNA-binding transcriptional regulator, LysR family [Faunimonas pinastri]|uniref:DNA-binding transcriptional regulator, LysR family n=1 Tax=Faunimonas pinastri TaxID=1855383 RepID=A0A1H8ZHY5_9HYPH|nr:LysR substrate-binding domain-containing protein [Faunimonas pinastri]SEP63847.1 DNA-binding transcriptional regulator, LysR family [Faunimonas pinastri]